MDRRKFLLNGLWWTWGALCGFHCTADPCVAATTSYKPFRPGKIAIIIDDIGYSLKSVQPFLDLNVPLTFSILPQLRRSRFVTSCIHAAGHEVMLHQPMEPSNTRLDPGPGALFVGDNVQRINRVLARNISDIPYIQGVNNHMGSRFTASRREMIHTIKMLKKNGLFFIDSLTSGQSVGYQTAREMKITACRNIFIDHIREPRFIAAQLFRLMRYALRHGWAIGIGHPFPETASAIKQFASAPSIGDIVYVPISRVLPASGTP